jgi:hypothetical protein
MTADSPSRRSVLTALAEVPAPGVPALADVANTSEPDPIFALIDAAKRAETVLLEASGQLGEMEEQCRANPNLSLAEADENAAKCCHVLCDAEDAVLDVKPRTLSGLAAQLMFAAERVTRVTKATSSLRRFW